MLRIPLDLRSQPLHMDIDEARVGGVPVPPHLLEQYLAAEYLPWPPGQSEQQIKLQRRELDRNAVPFDRMPVDADGKVTNSQGFDIDLFGGRHPAQPGLDPGNKLFCFEGLCHIVVGTGLEAFDNVDRVGLRR